MMHEHETQTEGRGEDVKMKKARRLFSTKNQIWFFSIGFHVKRNERRSRSSSFRLFVMKEEGEREKKHRQTDREERLE